MVNAVRTLTEGRSAALGQLLDRPAVAVGIAGMNERAPRLHVDIADIEPAVEQLLARSVRVGDDHLQSLDGSRRRIREALTERDRAGGTRWCELHEAQPVVDPLVMVGMEPDRVDIERFRPVDIGDGKNDELELPIHAIRGLHAGGSYADRARSGA